MSAAPMAQAGQQPARVISGHGRDRGDEKEGGGEEEEEEEEVEEEMWRHQLRQKELQQQHQQRQQQHQQQEQELPRRREQGEQEVEIDQIDARPDAGSWLIFRCLESGDSALRLLVIRDGTVIICDATSGRLRSRLGFSQIATVQRDLGSNLIRINYESNGES